MSDYSGGYIILVCNYGTGSTQPCIPLGSLNWKREYQLCWGKGGNVTSAGWRVTLWSHMQWCIGKNGGGYTQTGVAKGLKVSCLFMMTGVSIRCQKNAEVGIRRIPPNTPLLIWHMSSRSGVVTLRTDVSVLLLYFAPYWETEGTSQNNYQSVTRCP